MGCWCWHYSLSKLVETKNCRKYFIGYSNKVLRQLVLILLKINEYGESSKVWNGDKDKNNKLISFHMDVNNLLEKYKTI